MIEMPATTAQTANSGSVGEEAPCSLKNNDEDCATGTGSIGNQMPTPEELDLHEKEPEANEVISPNRRKLSCLCSPRCVIGLLLVSLIGYVIVDSSTTGHIRKGVKACLTWIEENPGLGFFFFTLLYVVATVLLIPGSVLTLGAGVVFAVTFGIGSGVAIGTLAVFVGASLGAIVSFLLARYLLHAQAAKLSAKYATFEALDLALRDNGLKIFVLLRLSPIIPFNVINYLGGVSSISLRDYSIALIAILPGTILYVFLGASAGSLADSGTSSQDPTVTIVVVVVGLIFGASAIWVTTRYARRELDQVLEQRQHAAELAATGSQESRGGDPESQVEKNESDELPVAPP